MSVGELLEDVCCDIEDEVPIPEPGPVDEFAFEPTSAAPGSYAKMEVLRQRLEAGFPLWHPHDQTIGEAGAEWYLFAGQKKSRRWQDRIVDTYKADRQTTCGG